MKKARSLLAILLTLTLTAAIFVAGMSTASAAVQVLKETDCNGALPAGIQMDNYDDSYTNPAPGMDWDHQNPAIKLTPVTDDGNGDLFCYKTEGRKSGAHGPIFTGDKSGFLKPIFDNPADTCTVSFDVKADVAVNYQIMITLTDSVSWSVNKWLEIGGVQAGTVGAWKTISTTFSFNSLAAQLDNPTTETALINSLKIGLGTNGSTDVNFKIDNLSLKIDSGAAIVPPTKPTLPLSCGFEEDSVPDYIAAASCTAALSTVKARNGAKSLFVSARANEWNSASITLGDFEDLMANQNQYIAVSMWVYSETATTGFLDLGFGQEIGGNWSTMLGDAIPIPANTWTELTGVFNLSKVFATPGDAVAATVSPAVKNAEGSAVTCEFYLDDITIAVDTSGGLTEKYRPEIPLDTSFENGRLDAFSLSSNGQAKMEVTDEKTYNGKNSVKISGRTEAGWEGLRISAETCKELIANPRKNYTVGAYVNHTAEENKIMWQVRISVDGDTSNDKIAEIKAATCFDVPGGEWVHSTGTFNLSELFPEVNTDDIKSVVLCLLVDGNCTYYVDGVQFYAGDTVPGYEYTPASEEEKKDDEKEGGKETGKKDDDNTLPDTGAMIPLMTLVLTSLGSLGTAVISGKKRNKK